MTLIAGTGGIGGAPAAAQRRGVVDDGEASRNRKDATNIHPRFRISGLGQLVEAGIQSDRLVVFGD